MKKIIFKGCGTAIITPFTEDGVNFEEWLKHYNLKGTLVINVKEEGLEMIIIKLLEKYNITNYMFLDEPFWYLLNSSRKINNKKIML